MAGGERRPTLARDPRVPRAGVIAEARMTEGADSFAVAHARAKAAQRAKL